VYKEKDELEGIIIGPEFSKFEIEMSGKSGLIPVQYNWESGSLRIVS